MYGVHHHSHAIKCSETLQISVELCTDIYIRGKLLCLIDSLEHSLYVEFI